MAARLVNEEDLRSTYPAIKILSMTVAPTAIPAISPTALVSVATAVATNKRLKVIKNSMKNAWDVVTLGTVSPPESKGL